MALLSPSLFLLSLLYNVKHFPHFHGNCIDCIVFAGKDIGKMFMNHENMFELIPDSFERKEDHKIIFTTLHLIFQKTRLSRFLSQSERDTLESNIVNLSKILFLKFKMISITTKMHHVLVHTVKFVSKYHTIGLFGEQALEREAVILIHHI